MGVGSFHLIRVRSLWTVYAKGAQEAMDVVLTHGVRNEVHVAEERSNVDAI